MPKLLIERFKNSKLNYIKESGVNAQGKHYIGRLEGPAADLLNPTRNGRKYGIKLWRNVENSEDFKEGMETLTIFGEADHPEDRLETSIKEIAVCLRKFEIRESEGIVWCSFDILDTPNGRIVKELLDYGSQLGVSSRGSGEEVPDSETGQNMIDPDTYLFICFDVVIMPAVKKARPTRVESVDRKLTSLNESIKVEIDHASTVQELNSMKSIIESAKLPDNDSLMESINNKLNELNSGDDISSELMKDLEESIARCKELEEENNKLRSKESANNIRISEMNQLIKSMKANSKNLVESLRKCHNEISEYKDNIAECTDQYSECLDTISNLRESHSKEVSLRKQAIEKVAKLERRISERDKKILKLKESISKSDNAINESKNKGNSIIVENRKLLAKVSSYEAKITELDESIKKRDTNINNLKVTNNKLVNENKSLIDKYISMKSIQCGFSEETIRNNLSSNRFSSGDIDRVVNELIERNDRLNRVPISLNQPSLLSITTHHEVDPEINQMTHILESMKNKK